MIKRKNGILTIVNEHKEQFNWHDWLFACVALISIILVR